MEKEVKIEEYNNYLLLNSLRVINECLINNGMSTEEEYNIANSNNVAVLSICVDLLLHKGGFFSLNPNCQYNINLYGSDVVFSTDSNKNFNYVKNIKTLILPHLNDKIGKIPFEFRIKFYIMLVNITALIEYLSENEKKEKIGLSYGKIIFKLLLALFGNDFINKFCKLSISEDLSQYIFDNISEYNKIYKGSETTIARDLIKFIYSELIQLNKKSERLSFEYMLLRMHEWFISSNDGFIQLLCLTDLNLKPRTENHPQKCDEYDIKNLPFLGYYNMLIFSAHKKIPVRSFITLKESLENTGNILNTL